MKKTLGIIGGMGPLATVKLFERIVLLTDAKSDQEHLHILIDNNTSIPDRTDYILQNISEDPREQLIASAERLKSIGADFLVMPCNTAHYFYDDIVSAVDIPILDMIGETAKYIRDNYKDVNTIGLLSTEGTSKAQVYENVFNKYGLNIIKSSMENQKYITELIYNIKKGIHHEGISGFYLAMEAIKTQGVDLFITGCTELSVAIELYNLQGNFIDPLEILAISAIVFSGGRVRR